MSIYSQQYKENAAKCELKIPFCQTCQQFFFYPRALCPHCLGAGWEWKSSTGRGKVYSFTIVRITYLEDFADKTPYIYAIIELDEGVRMAANIVDCPFDDVRVGMEVVWTMQSKISELPAFKPV